MTYHFCFFNMRNFHPLIFFATTVVKKRKEEATYYYINRKLCMIYCLRNCNLLQFDTAAHQPVHLKMTQKNRLLIYVHPR